MEQQIIIELIKRYCLPSGKVYPFSSYGLKHLFENLAGCYISNAEFKKAMSKAGLEPCREIGENAFYYIEIVNSPEIPIEYLSKQEQERRMRYDRLL